MQDDPYRYDLRSPFPQFDPVLVQIGPFGIRWYALAYIAGIVLGWRLLRRLVRQPPVVASRCRPTISSPGRRSASSSAAGWAMCCSTSRTSI